MRFHRQYNAVECWYQSDDRKDFSRRLMTAEKSKKRNDAIFKKFGNVNINKVRTKKEKEKTSPLVHHVYIWRLRKK